MAAVALPTGRFVMFLIDLDVLSMLRRRERNPVVAQWVARQRTTNLHLSVVSIGKIERGIAQQRRLNPAFADALSTWLDGLTTLYSERILAVDVPTARRWGQLADAIGHANADLMIATTALEHGLNLVTCNARHFKPTGARVLNPSIDEQ